jgi:hypothetical protein
MNYADLIGISQDGKLSIVTAVILTVFSLFAFHHYVTRPVRQIDGQIHTVVID